MKLLAIQIVKRIADKGLPIIGDCWWSVDGSLSKLQELYQRADRWLKSRPEPIKCQISFHSDSGDFSHVFGIYGREESRKLAAYMAVGVGPVFQTSDIRVFSKLGSIDYSQYMFNTLISWPTVLIECGSHRNDHDRAILVSEQGRADIAKAVVEGILAWAR